MNLDNAANSGNVVDMSAHKTVAMAQKATVKKSPKKATKKAPKATKGGNKKITKVSKECPARKGSKRGKLWGKISNGMTLDAAREAGIPLRFLKKMAKAGHLKIAA